MVDNTLAPRINALNPTDQSCTERQSALNYTSEGDANPEDIQVDVEGPAIQEESSPTYRLADSAHKLADLNR